MHNHSFIRGTSPGIIHQLCAQCGKPMAHEEHFGGDRFAVLRAWEEWTDGWKHGQRQCLYCGNPVQAGQSHCVVCKLTGAAGLEEPPSFASVEEAEAWLAEQWRRSHPEDQQITFRTKEEADVWLAAQQAQTVWDRETVWDRDARMQRVRMERMEKLLAQAVRTGVVGGYSGPVSSTESLYSNKSFIYQATTN